MLLKHSISLSVPDMPSVFRRLAISASGARPDRRSARPVEEPDSLSRVSGPALSIPSRGENAAPSDEIELADRLAARDPVEAERAQVDRFVAAGGNPLCEPSPDGWCLLEPVT